MCVRRHASNAAVSNSMVMILHASKCISKILYMLYAFHSRYAMQNACMYACMEA